VVVLFLVKNKMMQKIGFILVPLFASIGAWASLQVGLCRTTIFLMVSLGHGATWLLVSGKQENMAVLSALFDAGVAGSYFLAFILLGEPSSRLQWIGAILVVSGVSLLSSH
jgi:drug/metabolite transporter (DMT)-like permease